MKFKHLLHWLFSFCQPIGDLREQKRRYQRNKPYKLDEQSESSSEIGLRSPNGVP
jgi:hypothetical protein